LLEVRHLNAFYGAVQVLHDVNLFVGAGEIVAWSAPMRRARAR